MNEDKICQIVGRLYIQLCNSDETNKVLRSQLEQLTQLLSNKSTSANIPKEKVNGNEQA